jgi:hypothetical protein
MKYENQAYASKDLVLPSPWHEATPAAHITVTAVRVKNVGYERAIYRLQCYCLPKALLLESTHDWTLDMLDEPGLTITKEIGPKGSSLFPESG